MLIKLLIRNLQMIYRTLKSLIFRPFVVLKYKISSFTNVSKFLNQIPKFFASLLAKIKMKPEKREDYVDAGPVFIAKSLLIILIILIIAIPFLIYYFAWPWFVSLALTANFYVEHPKIENYDGKVRIYYEKEMKNLMFEGQLEKGKYTKKGKEFYINGMPKYTGDYLDGEYDGKGKLYSEDGKLLYDGDFKTGKYEGTGELTLSDGTIYKGDFSKGKRAGNGKIYNKDNKIIYEGNFLEDVLEGDGTEYYQNGNIKFKGSFKGGLYSGKGVFYNEKGIMIYEGNFERNLFSGEGRYYNDDGVLAYVGTFANGLYDGNGKQIFIPNSMWYEGSFLAGKASGEGKLFKEGILFYEGSFSDGMISGNGILNDSASGLSYKGIFENNDIAFGKLFELPIADIYSAFTKGLEADLSNDDYFYLYNKKYGIAFKFAYATAAQPPKMVAAYKRPQSGSITIKQGLDDLMLQGKFEKGESGTGWTDGYATNLLNVNQDIMLFYKAIYEGHNVYYWTNPESGVVTLIEYKSLAEQQGDVAGQSAISMENEKTTEYYAVYFQELGLNIFDFTSLGYAQ